MNSEDCATEALARASNQHLDDRVRQINALIAIAQELKRFNDRQERPNRSVDHEVKIQNNLRGVVPTGTLREQLGNDWLERYYAEGHQ